MRPPPSGLPRLGFARFCAARLADVDRNVQQGMHAPTGPYPHPYSGRHGLDMDSIRDSKAEIVAGITRDVMTNMRMR